MLGVHEQQIVDGLLTERAEIMSYGHINIESSGRVEELDRQINEIVGGDSFRAHELDDGVVEIEVDHEATDLDTGFEGNSYGFVSHSFHDPDLDY